MGGKREIVLNVKNLGGKQAIQQVAQHIRTEAKEQIRHLPAASLANWTN